MSSSLYRDGRCTWVITALLAKDDSNWVIQAGVLEGQAKTLTEHMKEVANNPNAMLLFSEMDAKRNRVRPFMLRL